MILHARLLWSVKLPSWENFENMLQMMYFDIYFDKICVKNDCFYIEIMMHAC